MPPHTLFQPVSSSSSSTQTASSPLPYPAKSPPYNVIAIGNLSLPIDTPVFPSRSQQPENAQVVRHRRIMATVLEAIGSAIVLGFLIALVRCTYRYKSPPKRDQIAEDIERRNLRREMEELERNRLARLHEPVPPYSPQPPSYAEAVGREVQTEHSSSRGTEASTNGLPTMDVTPLRTSTC